MKVRITQSSKPSYWYADKVGQEFYVTDHDHRSYKVTPGGHYIRMVDCDILSHTEFGDSYCVIPASITYLLNRLFNVLGG